MRQAEHVARMGSGEAYTGIYWETSDKETIYGTLAFMGRYY
jgi:hypothetical protein